MEAFEECWKHRQKTELGDRIQILRRGGERFRSNRLRAALVPEFCDAVM